MSLINAKQIRAAGADGAVQLNVSGVLGSSTLTYDSVNEKLLVGTGASAPYIQRDTSIGSMKLGLGTLPTVHIVTGSVGINGTADGATALRIVHETNSTIAIGIGQLAGQTSDAIRLVTSGNVSLFKVKSDGSIDIRQLVYTWPAAHGAGQRILTNDGSGALNWTDPTSVAPSSTAVITNPATSARNLIQATADCIELSVRAYVGQSVPIQQWEDSLGTVLAYVQQNGDIRLNDKTFRTSTTGTGVYMDPTGYGAGGSKKILVGTSGADIAAWHIQGGDSTTVNLMAEGVLPGTVQFAVRGATAQTANLQEWQNSSGTVLARVMSDGKVGMGVSIALNAAQASTVMINDSGVSRSGFANTSLSIEASRTDNAANAIYARDSGAGVILVARSDRRLGVGTGSPGATIHALAKAAADVVLIAQGTTSQTANLQEWQDAGGTVITRVTSAGAVNTDKDMIVNGHTLGRGPGGYQYSVVFGLGAGGYSAAANVAIGRSTLANLTLVGNATGNVGVGTNVMFDSTAGGYNVGVGDSALRGVTNGANNTAIGNAAGYSVNDNPSRCTFLGSSTSTASSGIVNSTAIGYQAQVTASNQIVLGNTGVTLAHVNGQLTISRPTSAGRRFLVQNADGGVVASIDDATSVPAVMNLSGQSLNISGISIRSDGGNGGINFQPGVLAAPFYHNHGSVGGAFIWRTSPTTINTPVEQMRLYGDGGLQLGGSFGVSSVARLSATATSAAGIAIIAQGASLQTANIQEWRDSAGATLGYVSNTGAAKFAGAYIAGPLQLYRIDVVATGGTTNIGAEYSVVHVVGTLSHTITLPTLLGGKTYFIKNTSPSNVTINCTGFNTIDNASSLTLGPNTAITVIGAGPQNWMLISTFGGAYTIGPAANAVGKLRNNGFGTLTWVDDNQGAVVYVNGTTGNDTTGLRGYEDRAFLTLEAAYAAMTSQDEIKLLGPVTMSTGIATPTKSIRINMETGAILTVATGVTAFANIQSGIRIYGRGAIALVGSAKLLTNVQSNFSSIEVNSFALGNASLANDYAIDYSTGILYINIASTLSQSSGGAGGFLKASGVALDIRACGQVSEATSRNTPMVFTTSTCSGTVYIGRQQGSTLTAGAAAPAMYDIALDGEFTIAGGSVFGDSTLVRLNAGLTAGRASITVTRQTGIGTFVEHVSGNWNVDAYLTGGASTQDLFVVNSASGIVHVRGVIAAASGKNAVKVTTGLCELCDCKVYGDVSIADTKTLQMAGTRVVGTVKSTSGTGIVKGVTPWTTTIFPTSSIAGTVPNVLAMS